MRTINPHQIRLCVAPMLDWTDRHCRVFHRLLAPTARLYTEMIHAKAILYGNRQRLLDFDPCEQPCAVQLGGSQPQELAQATAIATQWGYDEVNLNCGCPSDHAQAGQFGASLMSQPNLAAECISAMVKATPLPITVKCRLGLAPDSSYEQFARFIDHVVQAGCTMVIVHARIALLNRLSPKDNRTIPPLRYDWAYRLKQEQPQLPIVLNGGITDAQAAQTHLRFVDGVMLGRSAYQMPYNLHLLDTQLNRTMPRSRTDLLCAWRPYVEQQLGRGVPIRALSRHLVGLFHGQPGNQQFRRVLSQTGTKDWSLFAQALASMSTPAS